MVFTRNAIAGSKAVALAVLSAVGLSMALPGERAVIDKLEAVKAYALLNRIRANPVAYAVELDFRRYQAQVRPALIWNDTLEVIAERKALDMARRDYFGHVDPDGYGINYYIQRGGYPLHPDWLTDPRANYFESLQGGAEDGEQAIKNLILDINVPTKGHRRHLLGTGDWNASLMDIGIGFVRGTVRNKYQSYTCVVIAKHGNARDAIAAEPQDR